MQTAEAPLVEPFVVPDVYVSGLHDVEHLGEGEYRLTFFVKQRCGDRELLVQHVVAARLVMSLTSVFLLAKSLLKAIGVQCCGAIGRAGLIH